MRAGSSGVCPNGARVRCERGCWSVPRRSGSRPHAFSRIFGNAIGVRCAQAASKAQRARSGSGKAARKRTSVDQRWNCRHALFLHQAIAARKKSRRGLTSLFTNRLPSGQFNIQSHRIKVSNAVLSSGTWQISDCDTRPRAYKSRAIGMPAARGGILERWIRIGGCSVCCREWSAARRSDQFPGTSLNKKGADIAWMSARASPSGGDGR